MPHLARLAVLAHGLGEQRGAARRCRVLEAHADLVRVRARVRAGGRLGFLTLALTLTLPLALALALALTPTRCRVLEAHGGRYGEAAIVSRVIVCSAKVREAVVSIGRPSWRGGGGKRCRPRR